MGFQIVKQRLENENHCEIEEIRIGNSKESLDSLGDHNLIISEVVPVFGRYIRYYVKCNASPELQPIVNAFHILMQAGAARSNVNLPSPLIVKNKLHQLNNDLHSLFESLGLMWKADEVHGGTATKTVQVLSDVLWYIIMVLMQHCLSVTVKSQSFFKSLKDIINHKITSITNDTLTRCQEKFFWRTPKSCLQFLTIHSGID